LDENAVGTIVIETAIEVHRELGPGLLESVYEMVLAHEIAERGLSVHRQVPISVAYKTLVFQDAFRADLIIAEKVLVELKSVEQLNAAHRKQLQTYLRLTNLKLGYLLNFGCALMKEGIVRAGNGLPESPTYRQAVSAEDQGLLHRPKPERAGERGRNDV
jgi:GxxExxY protein